MLIKGYGIPGQLVNSKNVRGHHDKSTSFNQKESACLTVKEISVLEEVKNFRYLGALMESTSKDIKARKGICLESLQ